MKITSGSTAGVGTPKGSTSGAGTAGFGAAGAAAKGAEAKLVLRGQP